MKNNGRAQDESLNLKDVFTKFSKAFMAHPLLICLFSIVVFMVLCILFLMTETGIRVLNLALDRFSGEQYVTVEDRNRQIMVATTVNREIIDDVRDIKARMEKIERNLGNSSTNEERVILCGINNVDIQKWELSVATDNKYGLKLHDRVMIYNKDYSEHVPTAIFFVTAESHNAKENSPEVYMTEETANALDIPDANFKGKFSVVMKKLER